jgi:hypothetical protein
MPSFTKFLPVRRRCYAISFLLNPCIFISTLPTRVETLDDGLAKVMGKKPPREKFLSANLMRERLRKVL